MSKVTAYINPKATFELRVSEINKLNELIERDEAMPVKEADGSVVRCGQCDKWTSNKSFCSFCGQRLDTENIAF